MRGKRPSMYGVAEFLAAASLAFVYLPLLLLLLNKKYSLKEVRERSVSPTGVRDAVSFVLLFSA